MLARSHDIRFAITTQKPQLNRTEVLVLADKLRLKGKYKKAVAEYRRLIAHDGSDADAYSKMAPLLVKLRQRDEALKSFRAAAEAFVARGFVDRAIAVHGQAASAYPAEHWIWAQLGQLNHGRGRKAEAIKALLLGASRLSGRKRPEALKLLEQAHAYEPLHVDATLALCRLLKKAGRAPESKTLLEELAEGIRGPALARIRGAQFRLFPGFGTFFRWLRA
jgi:tetratricopeptide (TPR) repeat protein